MIITGLDFIVIAVMLISALLAMVRGLTREVLSIASWVVAAGATLYFFPRFQEDVRAMLQPNWLADISLAVGIFVITLIIVSFITMRISDFILDSRIGALDRTLGFVFGLFRGLLLVVIAYMFLAWLVPPENQPEWIREARSAPILKQTGDAIIALLPEDPERAILDKLRDGVDGGDETTPNDAITPQDTAPADGEETTGSIPSTGQGYQNSERDGLNQLLDSTRSGNQ
ncbi:CvpA family protein [Microbaculum marinum]|uniref:CvpA family protein n=1 Tax=Microbaculum marinum TaxID=1764581 RepID=A0AAW9RVG0_9HYPH